MPNTLPERCRSLAEDPRFQRAILVTIAFNAVLMGVETSAEVMRQAGPLLLGMNRLIQAIFVLEISVRLAATWPRMGRFFADGWNVFDFSIVALSLLPMAGPLANLARLARILRVARLIGVSGELRLIMNTMLRSIPSLGHVSLLLGVLVYVYALVGFHLFANTDPAHWGSLWQAIRTTFQILTIEGWPDIQNAVIERHPFSPVYFMSFIIVAVFVVVNLFIAVVLNNLEKARDEQLREEEVASGNDLLLAIHDLRTRLTDLEARLRASR